MSRAPSSTQKAVKRARSISATVAGAFLISGVVWILATDVLLYHLVGDRTLIARIETAKGWLFVALSALTIYVITHWAVRDLARSEATITAIVNSIGEGVLVIGRDRAISAANPASATILGVTHPDDLVGMSPQEFSRRFHVTDAQGRVIAPTRYLSQRALSGELLPSYKAYLHPHGRETVVILSTATPVRASPDGPVEASVSVMRDITQLEQLDVVRDQFFASAAHALKSPITVLKAQLHMLEVFTNAPSRSLEMIERQCGRLDRLADAILVLVRIQTGTLRLYPTRVDCAELIAEVAREMANASADHPLEMQTRAHPIVFGDPDRIAQTLRSMIEIAYRRARPHTGIRFVLDEAAGQAAVSVSYEPLGWNLDERHEVVLLRISVAFGRARFGGWEERFLAPALSAIGSAAYPRMARLLEPRLVDAPPSSGRDQLRAALQRAGGR